MSDAPKPDKDPLRGTLNLPQTDFAMKANLLQMEPEMQKRWDRIGIYAQLRAAPHPRGAFVFHDGPPYANGNIHLGHLLNKVLKDLVVRSRGMAGYDVQFVPGWDCHGLPIEHQVMKELGAKAKELTVAQIRTRCKDYATKFIDLQRTQMRRLGTEGDYSDPYLTMAPAYEGATLELFAELIERGLVYRDLKPVHWSVANRTALAEAELEYYDKDDVSVFVRFALSDASRLPAALGRAPSASLLIWTTTPWTLPANLAVAVAPRETYGLYAYGAKAERHHVIVAAALHERVFAAAKISDAQCLGTCPGEALVGLGYVHPFAERTGAVVSADYVTIEDGTGLVHTAPGHGTEDYQTGLRYGLAIYCPVREDGTYDDTVPGWLRGKDIWTANPEIVAHLRASGHLFHEAPLRHSYPHDWRSKTPTIYRATEQWFIGVDREVQGTGKTLRALALEAIDQRIAFVPEWGQSRLRGMLESRPDWCISRQRAWGLPIPAFMHEGQAPFLTAASVRAVAKQVRAQGADVWFSASAPELLGDYDPARDPDAPAWLKSGGRKAIDALKPARDIFDVWFESGSSWRAVLGERKIGFPAELYLEGSDQHRGWFQTSLLPALGATGSPPYKALLTHGFILDGQGRAMSKSLGNVIGVEELLKKHGADICRWWVAGANYTHDIRADWAFFQAASEDYRKVRNTVRFFLSNLYDFDVTRDARPVREEDATTVDAWAAGRLDELIEEVTTAYDSYQTRRLRDALFNFLNDDMSAVYLAAIKDRLYCEAPSSPKRRRTQTVLHEITSALLRLLAPILVHTADQAWLALHKSTAQTADARSVHLELFPRSQGRRPAPAWTAVLALRGRVLKALEEAKASGVSNPLDAGVVARVPAAQVAALAPYTAELVDLCGVSRLRVEAGDGVSIESLANEPRCQRSWKRDGTVRARDNGYLLSDRDAVALAARA